MLYKLISLIKNLQILFLYEAKIIFEWSDFFSLFEMIIIPLKVFTFIFIITYFVSFHSFHILMVKFFLLLLKDRFSIRELWETFNSLEDLLYKSAENFIQYFVFALVLLVSGYVLVVFNNYLDILNFDSIPEYVLRLIRSVTNMSTWEYLNSIYESTLSYFKPKEYDVVKKILIKNENLIEFYDILSVEEKNFIINEEKSEVNKSNKGLLLFGIFIYIVLASQAYR